MAAIRKNERWLNLVSFLLKMGRPVPWEVIRRDVEGYNAPDECEAAVQRRFARDKAALRAMGVPLEYRTDAEWGITGYYIPPGSYSLPVLNLTPAEVAVLAFVARAAAAHNAAVSPAAVALRTALQKLQFDSPIPGDVRTTVEERYLFHQSGVFPDKTSREAAVLEQLTVAVLENRAVKFTYRAVVGEAAREGPAARTVDPYGIAHWRGHWYVVGRCHERKAVRCFRVDRIVGAVSFARRGKGGDFTVPVNFRLEDYIGRPPWELAARAPTRVVIRLDEVVAWMVAEERQSGDRLRRTPGGGAILERTVSDPEAFVHWLLRFGAHAELLSPQHLRVRLADEIRRVRALYEAPVQREG